jgi:predicted small lipoprotein YifL
MELIMQRNRSTLLATVLCLSVLALNVTGCKQKGPLEQAGEEVDEAVDTAKHGGKESVTTKADDAVDDLRDGTKDAAHDLKDK